MLVLKTIQNASGLSWLACWLAQQLLAPCDIHQKQDLAECLYVRHAADLVNLTVSCWCCSTSGGSYQQGDRRHEAPAAESYPRSFSHEQSADDWAELGSHVEWEKSNVLVLGPTGLLNIHCMSCLQRRYHRKHNLSVISYTIQQYTLLSGLHDRQPNSAQNKEFERADQLEPAAA